MGYAKLFYNWDGQTMLPLPGRMGRSRIYLKSYNPVIC